MKLAMENFTDALEYLSKSTTGKMSSSFIDKFKADMKKVLGALEDKKPSAKERAKARKTK